MATNQLEICADDSKAECKLCYKMADESQLGPLYEFHNVKDDILYRAHYFCLLFSSGLVQNGGEDDGIKGFLPDDILKEWRRGQRLKCAFCAGKYATVGCKVKKCSKTYHVPCAIDNACLLQGCSL